MPSFWDSDGNLIDKRVEIANSRYKDLGLVIDAANMAAGAIIVGNTITGTSWVRNITLFVQSDQQYDVGFNRVDPFGSGDLGVAIGSGAAAVTSPSWRSHTATGATALLGYSVKFYFKNVAAVPNTYGKVRVQLMGL